MPERPEMLPQITDQEFQEEARRQRVCLKPGLYWREGFHGNFCIAEVAVFRNGIYWREFQGSGDWTTTEVLALYHPIFQPYRVGQTDPNASMR